jgi:hypothetical protein
MIILESKGEYKQTKQFLNRITHDEIYKCLNRYGQEGVVALASATPKDSGKTASSWRYELKQDANSYSIIWSNTNIVRGTPVAVLIQYGHGTGTGGFVQGRDYINPALRPIFDRIANEVWREVTRA